jgi:sulfate transport system permease protein
VAEVTTPQRRTTRRKSPTTWVFRVLAIGYLFLLVAWPVSLVAKETFADGFQSLGDAFSDPDVTSALSLTARIALIAVLINTVFGVGVSILLVRYRFPGRRLLSAFVDLPLSVSPVVVGLSLMLVYGGRNGWFGPWLEDHAFQVVFAVPAMVMATSFVSLPLVIREVVPVLHEVGTDQEQAAKSLGASAPQTFWRITLPAIKWAVVYGVVLSLARSLGEFGAVKVVSGNVAGRTQTATLVVDDKYRNFAQPEAYAMSFLLAAVSVVCIVVVSLLRPNHSVRTTSKGSA